MGWHRLLLQGDALEESAEANHDRWRQHHDAERRRLGYEALSDEGAVGENLKGSIPPEAKK